MTGAPKPTKRKGRYGGTPGNANALRHGFYSRRTFTEIEMADLDVLEVGLQSEIAALRVWLRRLSQAAHSQKDLSPHDMTDIVVALSGGFNRLAGLLRTQKLLFESVDSSKMALKIMSEVLEELQNDDTPQPTV